VSSFGIIVCHINICKSRLGFQVWLAGMRFHDLLSDMVLSLILCVFDYTCNGGAKPPRQRSASADCSTP
jgi:hypothetical protein